MAAVALSFSQANRGALTTIFTPPASCLDETTLVSYPTSLASNTSNVFSTSKIFINHFSWGNSDCYPPTIATTQGSTRWGNGYYYSPGICPSGWTSACQISTSALAFPTSLNSDTTGVMCCPTNWDCVTGSTTLTAHGCTSLLWEGQVLTSVWAAPQPTSGVPLVVPSSRSLGNYTMDTDNVMTCDAIPVLWQSTDIAILSLLGIPYTSSGTGSQISSVIPTPTNTATPSTSSTPKSGISTGAKAAIGVVIPVVFLAVVLGIFFFFRRRGTKKETHYELPASTNSTTWAMEDVVKKDGGELDSGERYEAAGGPIMEMGVGERDIKKQLPEQPPIRYEMDGDTVFPNMKR